MTVQKTYYKDVPAVLVQTQTLQAWILPEDGYSITLEPCSLPFDAPSVAAKRGLTGDSPPNSVFTFEIKIQLKEVIS